MATDCALTSCMAIAFIFISPVRLGAIVGKNGNSDDRIRRGHLHETIGKGSSARFFSAFPHQFHHSGADSHGRKAAIVENILHGNHAGKV